MKIRSIIGQAIVGLSLFVAAASSASTTYTWVGTAGDNLLGDTNNWSPLLTTLPNSALNDTLQWNGSAAGNLILTNTGAGFDSNPGFYINVTAGQVGAVTLVEASGSGRIRLNGTNSVNIAAGAGAFSFGNGGAVTLPITLAGKGTGETHPFTNNSANTATLNSETYFVCGGGGAHTLALAGTGNWLINSTFQAQNSGSSVALAVNGSGVVSLIGTPAAGIVYAGSFGNVTVNSGTLQLGAPSAIGNGNTLVLAGGSLDSSVAGLVNAGNNPQSWNGNFAFAGTQSLDLGFGPVTMNASRIVTVKASTLTVDGAIAGTGFSLTKSGAGTLLLNNANTYTGGTVISNGVLQLGNSSAIPTSQSLTVLGTLDLNGQSPTVSTLNGTGIVDTIAGGAPTLTVIGSSISVFSGSLRNTAGSLALALNDTGSVTLGGASTYSGGTTVASGTLLVTNTSGSGTGSGTVTVSSGATFGGSGIVTGPVSWQSGAQAAFTQGSPLTVSGTVTLSGNALIINIPGGTPLGTGNYTLMTYNNAGSSGSFAGAPTFTGAGVAAGTTISVTNGNGVVALVVASSTSGTAATWISGNGNWSAPANWSSNPQIPQKAGDAATLGLGSAFTTVTLDTLITNAAVTFTNANSFSLANAGNPFTFDNTNSGAALVVANGSSNSIAPAISLNDNLSISVFSGAAMTLAGVVSSTSPGHTIAVSGAGTLTLNGNNTYGPPAGSIGTTIAGSDTLQLGNNNALGAGDVNVMNSGTLRALTALNTANNFIISNGVTTSVDNNGNNVTLSGVISGAGALGKNGAGILTLSGANTYNGNTSLSTGGIKLGNASGIPGGNGNGNVNMGTNTTVDLNGFSPILNGLNANGPALVDSLSGGAVTLTLGESGSFATYYGNIQNTAGSLALVKDGAGNQTLAGTNIYTGGTTINAGLLRVGNGNTNALAGLGSGPVVDNGTLEFNLVGTNAFTNAISGGGAVNLANNNLTLVLATANTFSGSLNVNDGSLWLKNASALGTGPKQVVVDNGTAGNSQLHLDGSLGNITTDPTIDFYLSNLAGNLFNESGTNTIQGNIYIPFGGGAAYVIVNGGFLTLAGNVADGGTFNASRVLQLGGAGNGLFSGVANDNGLNGNPITLGSITKVDSGTWTVSGANTTVGALNVNAGKLVLSGAWAGGSAVVSSGGTLIGTGSASNLTVNAGGNFVPGAYGSVGSFTVSNLLTLSGTTYISLNKALGQPNTMVLTLMTNAVANPGSSLTVSNLGAALVTGDTFYLFNQPVTNGNLMTITAPAGVTFTNNLAVDGSITVLPNVATNPTNITAQVAGNQLILAWPADHTGWHLQAQTNSLATGLGTNWVTISGTDANNSYTNPIVPANGSVFYRIVYP